jgi:3-oxoacyl-[acyl-carrier-protein] synthase II
VRRVAITGIGLLTPLAVGTEETWSGLVEGRSAVGPIRGWDASSLRTQIGAEVPEFDGKQFVTNRRSLRTMTRFDLLAMVAAVMAVRDSGLQLDEDPDGRVGLFTASNKETSEPEKFEDAGIAARGDDGRVDIRRFGEAAPSVVPPLFYIEGLQGASLFYISEGLGLKGANTYFAGTAEAGLTAIGRAYRAVRRGEADVALAGGGDVPVGWWNMSRVDSLGILTGRNELGAGACQPYDRDRDGTVMGEGGAFVLLEDYDAASGRGARIYAEVSGFGAGADVARLITPDASGQALAAAMASAMREAEVGLEEVDYVAAHGSGTRLGDASEARALTATFGSRGNGPAASSVKPATGHLGAAAGALNVAIAALAIHHGLVPPTLNLRRPDPACAGVDWVAEQARETRIRHALAVARGLEGQNVALALRAV